MVFDGDITYAVCCGICPQDEQAAGCHAECDPFVADSIRRLSLIKAARYQYEPLLSQDKRRGQWLHARWSYYIQQEYRLPAEICSRIEQLALIEPSVSARRPGKGQDVSQ